MRGIFLRAFCLLPYSFRIGQLTLVIRVVPAFRAFFSISSTLQVVIIESYNWHARLYRRVIYRGTKGTLYFAEANCIHVYTHIQTCIYEAKYLSETGRFSLQRPSQSFL